MFEFFRKHCFWMGRCNPQHRSRPLFPMGNRSRRHVAGASLSIRQFRPRSQATESSRQPIGAHGLLSWLASERITVPLARKFIVYLGKGPALRGRNDAEDFTTTCDTHISITSFRKLRNQTHRTFVRTKSICRRCVGHRRYVPTPERILQNSSPLPDHSNATECVFDELLIERSLLSLWG